MWILNVEQQLRSRQLPKDISVCLSCQQRKLSNLKYQLCLTILEWLRDFSLFALCHVSPEVSLRCLLSGHRIGAASWSCMRVALDLYTTSCPHSFVLKTSHCSVRPSFPSTPHPPSHFPRTPFPQIPASAYQCNPTCGLLHFQSRQRAASGPSSQQHVTTRLPSPENCTGSSTPTNEVQTPEWACTALRCGGPFPPYSVPLPSNVLSPPQHLCHSFYLQWPLCTLPAATIPSILYNVWKITYLPGSLPWLPKPEILWSNSLWCTQHALNFLSRLSVRLFYLLNLIAQALLLYYHFIPLRTIQYLLEKMTFYSLLLLPMYLIKQNKCSFEM